jgi:hypothetical protein
MEEGLPTYGVVLWWIGVAALFLVVIPVVLVLAQRVITHISEIKGYADDVLAHGVAVTENLEPVPALLETRDLTKSVSGKFGQYVSTVNRLL